MTEISEDLSARQTRARIMKVTAELLAASPTGKVSNREVCDAAGITPPTLYHHFGDKDGLVQAVVTDAFERYLARKRSVGMTGDLVTDFRRGWDMHVEFGVENPTLYDLMYGRPLMERASPAAETARSELLAFMRRFENAGRLRLPVETATDVVESAATGVTLHLVRTRLPASAPAVAIIRDAVMAAVIAPTPIHGHATASPDVITAAARLRDKLPRGPVATLRASEAALLHDWLEVLSTADPDQPPRHTA
jgi:AcrR family transcriptional regulator